MDDLLDPAEAVIDTDPERPEYIRSNTDDDGLLGDPAPGKGPLLELPEKKAAKLAAELFFARKKEMKRRIAQWRVNELRRRGVPAVGIIDGDDGPEAYVPGTVSPDDVPAINKAASICRRLTSILFADPPAADPVPSTFEDEDADAAETSGRILADIDSESGLNSVSKWRKCVDRGHSYGSGFEHVFVDPKGGGYQPITVQAGQDATSLDDALGLPEMQPVIDPLTQQPVIDPATGEPQMQPATDPATGEPLLTPWPEFVTRYVKPDRTLTDVKADAAYRWVPALKSEVLTGRHFRFIPHDAEDIWAARGGQIGSFRTWGEWKDLYPDLADLETDEIKKLFEYRPENMDELLPAGMKLDESRSVEDKDADEQPIFGITTYMVQGADYAEGCICVSLGDSVIAHRDVWVSFAEDGSVERLDIPVSQFGQFDEGIDDPYKVALMQIIGPGNEVRLAVWGAMLDYLEDFGRRLTYLPMHSNISPEQVKAARRNGGALPILPGSQPFFEQLPDFPQFFAEIWQIAGDEQQEASGLEDAMRGMADPNVTSGRQQYLVISQVHAGLSEIKQNTERGIIRAWRIRLQLARAYYDTPRQLKWIGDDGDYKQMEWLGTDLSTAADVQIRAGTFTMMAPAQKALVAEHLQALGVYDQSEFRDMVTKNVGGIMGLQDSPFRMRIRRQLKRWADGPPEGWQPQEPQPQQVPVAVADQLTGLPVQQMVEQMVVPPDPELARIFEPTPADTAPAVVHIRLEEISRFMSGKKYMSKPPAWRKGLDDEYLRLAQAAQPVPQTAPGGAKPLPQQGPVPGADTNGNPLNLTAQVAP